ncbi:hypothetical protein [Piscibacillus salipiscarius]|uniref:DUF3899 domain-containing protein n=1 Tax=Piscibacillus salipiscarius TaxID=299480 RepID=A0ABW5QBU7_9BACI
MSTAVYLIIGVLFVVTLIGTFLIGKNETNKVKKYEQEGHSPKDELKRSWEYETSSLQKNIPSLLIIYGVVVIASIIALAIYIF